MVKQIIQSEFVIFKVHYRHQETFDQFPGLASVIGVRTATLEGCQSCINCLLYWHGDRLFTVLEIDCDARPYCLLIIVLQL